MGKDGVLDLFSAENKLDGSNNYPLWSYMMKHILVANGLSKIVEGTEVRLGTRATSQDDDSATTSTIIYGRRIPPPPPVPYTEAQQKWDEKDAKAHAKAHEDWYYSTYTVLPDGKGCMGLFG